LDYKEEKMSADIFSELFLACAAGAKEGESSPSLDVSRPEETRSVSIPPGPPLHFSEAE